MHVFGFVNAHCFYTCKHGSHMPEGFAESNLQNSTVTHWKTTMRINTSTHPAKNVE